MTFHYRFFKHGALIAALLTTIGCNADKTKGAAPPQERESAAPARAELTDDATSGLSEVLASYERVRALLADDQLDQVAEAAAAMEKAAREATGKAPAALDADVQAIATAARALAAISATEEADLRRAFGDVSRPVVSLIGSAPVLAQGRHLFECPMADGYSRWVQTNETMSNPYMGKRMLACGAAVAWQ